MVNRVICNMITENCLTGVARRAAGFCGEGDTTGSPAAARPQFQGARANMPIFVPSSSEVAVPRTVPPSIDLTVKLSSCPTLKDVGSDASTQMAAAGTIKSVGARGKTSVLDSSFP